MSVAAVPVWALCLLAAFAGDGLQAFANDLRREWREWRRR